MTPRLLPAGSRAVLLETDDLATTLAVTERLREARLPEIEDLVPAAETVLVQVVAGTDLATFGPRLLSRISDLEVEDAGTHVHDPFVIGVRYDGPDLDDVAAAAGLSRAEIITAHTGKPWRAAFVGFSPGFAYLAGGDRRLAVPRRTESRTNVPAGAVALAGEFSAVYPRQSPGGWQIIGSTDATLWNTDADPPAAIEPGRWVIFVDIGSATADLAGTDRPTENGKGDS